MIAQMFKQIDNLPYGDLRTEAIGDLYYYMKRDCLALLRHNYQFKCTCRNFCNENRDNPLIKHVLRDFLLEVPA